MTSWHKSDPLPALAVHPPDAASLDEAHAAIEQWEHYSRKRLDSAQRLAVELMMAETSEGMWAAKTTGRCESRQNGKGDEVEVVEAWGLTQRAEAIVHTAHEIPTAKSAHLRLVAHLEGHRDLRRLVSKVRYANGDQAIELHNGGIVVYRTRTAGGGRGLDDISRLVVDEAQHAQPEQLASATPILGVAPNPQTNFIGSAGIAGRSAWWWSLRKRALGGSAGRFSWLEHSAELVTLSDDGQVVSEAPEDPADRDAWRRANPGYPERISGEFLEEQLRLLGAGPFAREHLSVWDPPEDDLLGGRLFPPGSWDECGRSGRPAELPVRVLAVATSVDDSFTSIVAGSVDDEGHVWARVLRRSPGRSWALPELLELSKKHGVPVAVDSRGPAASLIEPLERGGVEVKQASTQDFLDACAEMSDRVADRTFRHVASPELDEAVAGATKRKVGDRWAWGRRKSTADISPLEAATLVVWAAVQPNLAPAFMFG